MKKKGDVINLYFIEYGVILTKWKYILISQEFLFSRHLSNYNYGDMYLFVFLFVFFNINNMYRNGHMRRKNDNNQVRYELHI